jgi:hypothetical protein
MGPSAIERRPSFLITFILSTLLALSLGLFSAYGDERLYQRSYDTLYDFRNREIRVDVECHSGSPPVLEWVIAGTDMDDIRTVSFDFESDGEIDLALEKFSGEVLFRGSPYRKAGTYTASLFIETSYGRFMREFVVSFADFQWGRDNFRFANDGKFENKIGFVSETVAEWARERFGTLSKEQEALLIYLMYKIYKGSIGRCYGFSGGEVYYHTHPESIPKPYTTVYEIDELDPRIVRQMDFLQNDIVFENFISGKIDLVGKQGREGLEAELDLIEESIGNGKTVIIPYLSKKMHHSMVVYGYFENLYRNKVTLLVANNWERDQENNSYSEDAENIVIELSKSDHNIKWYDLTKRRHRYPEEIFFIPCDELSDLRKQDFLSLLGRTEEEIVKRDRLVLMVEQAEKAYLVDGEGKKRGYSRPKMLNEIPEIDVRKVDYNFVFEIPRGNIYTLFLKEPRYNKEKKTYKKVNVIGIAPKGGRIETFVFPDIDISVQRTFIVDGIRYAVEQNGQEDG